MYSFEAGGGGGNSSRLACKVWCWHFVILHGTLSVVACTSTKWVTVVQRRLVGHKWRRRHNKGGGCRDGGVLDHAYSSRGLRLSRTQRHSIEPGSVCERNFYGCAHIQQRQQQRRTEATAGAAVAVAATLVRAARWLQQWWRAKAGERCILREGGVAFVRTWNMNG